MKVEIDLEAQTVEVRGGGKMIFVDLARRKLKVVNEGQAEARSQKPEEKAKNEERKAEPEVNSTAPVLMQWLHVTGKRQTNIIKQTGLASGIVSLDTRGMQKLPEARAEKYAAFFGVTKEEFLAGPQNFKGKREGKEIGVGGVLTMLEREGGKEYVDPRTVK